MCLSFEADRCTDLSMVSSPGPPHWCAGQFSRPNGTLILRRLSLCWSMLVPQFRRMTGRYFQCWQPLLEMILSMTCSRSSQFQSLSE